jgi:pyruvate dehydrogenase (quinone)
MIGIRFPMEINLVGDAKETLGALIPLVQYKKDRDWQRKIEMWVQDWWDLMEARAMTSAEPINPQRVFWELSSHLPDECIITVDAGSGTNWFARDLKLTEGMRASVSGNLATMGCAVPYAIGAKWAHPDRPVLAVAGDGAMQMNGINELITIAKYWARWSDPRLVVLVVHNNDLNLVTWEMRALEGDPKFEASQALPDVNYAAFAESLGLSGIRVESPDQLDSAWDKAFRADRPVVVDAVTDPNVPPLPPHVSWEQAGAMLSSLLKGDPDSAAVIRNSFKSVLAEYIPG